MNANKRSWKHLWCDSRKRIQDWSVLAIFAFVFIWFTAISYASNPMPERDDITEHATTIMSAQMYVILALVGLLVSLISFVFLSNVRDIKSTMRANIAETEKTTDKIFDLLSKKVDKDDCDRLRDDTDYKHKGE